MTKKLLLDQPDEIVVFVFDGGGQPASANVLDRIDDGSDTFVHEKLLISNLWIMA
jgi:hypothetical protein